MFVECLILVVVFCFWWYLEDKRNHQGFPPGPRRYPIIGTLPSLIRNISKPVVLLENLAKEYGDVIFLSVGSFEAVIFNSYDAIMDILTHEKALDRKAVGIPVLSDLHDEKNLGLIYGSGKSWITLRHFTLRTLRDFGFGKSQVMDFVINEEIEKFMNHLDKLVDAGDNKKTILFHEEFQLSVTNVLWRLVTGESYKLDDPKMLELMEIVNRVAAGSSLFFDPGAWFPILRDIFPKLFAKSEIKNATDEMVEFCRETIEQRRSKGTYLTDPQGFLDCFLQKGEENQNNPDSPFSDEQMLMTVTDLFQAGSDTSSNTLEFSVLYMLLHPEVQKKVQEEIDSVVPDNSRVVLSHKSKLIYVQATILEIHRFSSLVPMNLRTASDDFIFHGHVIKKGTILLTHLQGHHYSKKAWGDPYSFRPERFLTSDGTLDLKLADSILAFGAGKRVCAGRSLADSTIFLYFTTLLRHYEFLRAPGKPDPTLKTTSAFLNIPKPFYVRIVKRKPTITSP